MEPPARWAGLALERAVHHERVNQALARRGERQGQPAHNVEPQRLPEPDRPLVAADDEIELHCTKPAGAGDLERMGVHLPGYPAACRLGRGHVTAIADVPSAARLVGADIVGTDDAIAVVHHERLAVGGSYGPDYKEIFDFAKGIVSPTGEGTLIKDEAFRQKLADWIVRAEGYKLARFRTMTALSKVGAGSS